MCEGFRKYRIAYIRANTAHRSYTPHRKSMAHEPTGIITVSTHARVGGDELTDNEDLFTRVMNSGSHQTTASGLNSLVRNTTHSSQNELPIVQYTPEPQKAIEQH